MGTVPEAERDASGPPDRAVGAGYREQTHFAAVDQGRWRDAFEQGGGVLGSRADRGPVPHGALLW
jgi:hypothetical protein